ncbi:MAG: hypothetical protein K2O81_05455 [Clostridia bacterium]|nr:hypothetical protein [Clostridia bacterium]
MMKPINYTENTEKPESLIYQEIANDGFVKTWAKYNAKHNKYYKITSWLSGLLWLPFIIVLIVFIVKVCMLSSESFSKLDDFALGERRKEIISDLTLWADLLLVTFFVSATSDSVPDLVKSFTMVKWVNDCGIDLSRYITLQKSDTQNLPPDMNALTECLYYSKNKDKNSLKLVVAVIFFAISLILSVIMFVCMSKTATWFIDVEIWKKVGQGQTKPAVAPAVPVIVSFVLMIIAELFKKVVKLSLDKTIKKWTERVQIDKI